MIRANFKYNGELRSGIFNYQTDRVLNIRKDNGDYRSYKWEGISELTQKRVGVFGRLLHFVKKLGTIRTGENNVNHM